MFKDNVNLLQTDTGRRSEVRGQRGVTRQGSEVSKGAGPPTVESVIVGLRRRGGGGDTTTLQRERDEEGREEEGRERGREVKGKHE